ncbi:protein EARLY FLOWERING 4-like, partial [Trifolium medium]|nr:protein EARLY FLOWERING 4-like [Trifolium medium]
MEDTNNRRSKKNRRRPSATPTNGEYSDVEDAEDGDPEAWATLNKSFRQVQSVLDRNRAIIQQ